MNRVLGYRMSAEAALGTAHDHILVAGVRCSRCNVRTLMSTGRCAYMSLRLSLGPDRRLWRRQPGTVLYIWFVHRGLYQSGDPWNYETTGPKSSFEDSGAITDPQCAGAHYGHGVVRRA